MKKRIAALVLAMAMVFALVACGGGGGGEYPSEQINMFCHAAAGGGSDSMARTLAAVMQENFGGNPVVVDNKTGGTGSVCWQALIASKADGYTISTVASELTYIGALGYADIGPDDVDYIGLCVTWPGALFVPADSEWNTFEDFLNACKANPGTITVGDGGVGNIWQIAAYLMEKETGVSVTHVPCDGANGAITNLLGDHCDAIVVGAPEGKSNVESGALKCLAVFNDKASAALPDAPITPDLGYPGLICNVWVGIGCPKDMDESIKNTLIESVKTAVESETFQKFANERGYDLTYEGPDDLYARAKADTETYSALIADVGLKAS